MTPVNFSICLAGRFCLLSVKRSLPIIFLFFSSCMVSRISLPEINGRVFEKTTGKSISGVIVRNGETVLASSDKRGFFKIKQKTYREFTFPGNEAPPLHFELVLEKQGYCEEVYKYHDDHGGASSTQPWEKSFHLQPRNMSQDCD